MKEMEINRGSWHYKLAKKFGGLTYHHDDFCSYTRRVLLGMLSLFCLTLLATLAVYMVTSGAYFIYLRFALGHWPKEGWYAVGVFIDVVILLVCAIIGIIAGGAWWFERAKDTREERRHQQRVADEEYYARHGSYPVREPETHFIRDSYRAFKEKTCYRITLE